MLLSLLFYFNLRCKTDIINIRQVGKNSCMDICLRHTAAGSVAAWDKVIIIIIYLGPRHIQPSTYTNVTAPPVRLLGGECIIPKSTQYVTVVTDITQ